ncbi:MAG: hypothetical protein ACKVOH_06915 [Chlamydiales bacterium]
MALCLDRVGGACDAYSKSRVGVAVGKFGSATEVLDYTALAVQSVATIADNAAKLQGKTDPAAQSVGHKFTELRTGLDIVRTVPAVASLVYCVESDGKGHYKVADWLKVSVIVSSASARILNGVKALHDFKAIDLGKHASRIGNALIILFTVIVSFSFVKSLRDFVGKLTEPARTGTDEPQKQRQETREAGKDFARNCAYLASLPFELGIGMSTTPGQGSPALAIAGASVSLVAAVTIIAIEGGDLVHGYKRDVAEDSA